LHGGILIHLAENLSARLVGIFSMSWRTRVVQENYAKIFVNS